MLGVINNMLGKYPKCWQITATAIPLTLWYKNIQSLEAPKKIADGEKKCNHIMSIRRKCLWLILPNFDTTIKSTSMYFTHYQQEGECSNQKYYRDTSAEEEKKMPNVTS